MSYKRAVIQELEVFQLVGNKLQKHDAEKSKVKHKTPRAKVSEHAQTSKIYFPSSQKCYFFLKLDVKG